MDRLIQQKRARIIEVAARHGAGNVRVFGSRARGDARPESDADFLIDIVGPTSPWFPGGLIVDLRELLGCEVDVGMPQELHPLVRERVLAEAVKL
ncbi:MAG TPA: nucleotidyltransferase domain-containing protein [Tepidisphaeraceae bacterium]|nr:nucleotidyltransferase domain-containing protein [Tepidisphaeraceae bacterium]